MIFSVSIKSSQSEFIKSFNLSPFLPTKASHSPFESKPLQLVFLESDIINYEANKKELLDADYKYWHTHIKWTFKK